MPWYLTPPRPGKTPFYAVRGSYCGIILDGKSTGATDERAAKRILATWRKQAERGEFATAKPAPIAEPLTLARGALDYLRAGHDSEALYVDRIVAKYGKVLLADLHGASDFQVRLGEMATALYPNAPVTTVNRNFYTPISSILKHNGFERKIKRPKGARGKKSEHWLREHQAFDLLDAAYTMDREFGIFCELLLYTGMRLDEALSITWDNVDLDACLIFVPKTKNGQPRPVHLTPWCRAGLLNHPARKDSGRTFRFYAGGQFNRMLKDAMRNAGVPVPPKRYGGFHLFCHTYATWQVQFNGMTNYELADTGRWDDPASAKLYNHRATSDAAKKADLLPTRSRNRGPVLALPAPTRQDGEETGSVQSLAG